MATKLSNPVMVCPKHGDVTESVSVTMDIPQRGHYCLVCYAEWLAENFPKLQPKEQE